jgi:DNA mismatch repair protein MutL
MSVISSAGSIHVLSPQLADQIAAGEVIERPASVVKELIENSLDAGATRVEVELQRGGIGMLRVTDNGSGIVGAELPLAICRHATSKIAQLEDLHNLHSLGFRGEALASICSVSQWELGSRRDDCELGYQLNYQHPNKPQPTNYAVGTTVTINNLFYNTPARRKFLRSEQTEYRHCDDVICRLMLSRFDTAFYVKHNQRQVYRLPVALDEVGRTRRAASVLGENVIAQSLLIDFSWQDMRVWGWISRPDYSRQQSDLQYFYINGRIIRDRVINHAIRRAYQDSLPAGRHPAYVLYLEVDPQTVDVNVHPTKHEVRFYEIRRVHDFITRCLRDGINDMPGSPPYSTLSATASQTYAGLPMNEPASHYPLASHPHHAATVVTVGAEAKTFSFLFNRFLLIERTGGVLVIDVPILRAHFVAEKLTAHDTAALITRPLLIPLTIELHGEMLSHIDILFGSLAKLGFELTRSGPRSVMLRTIPACLPALDLAALLPQLLQIDLPPGADTTGMPALITVISTQIEHATLAWDQPALQLLIQEMAARNFAALPATWLISAEQFAHWLAQQRCLPPT